MNTDQNAQCGTQAVKIVPALVWSGLGLCVAVATIYDLGEIFGW